MWLQLARDMIIVGEAGAAEEALELAPLCKPDVVLMDMAMPRLDGITTTQRLLALYPACAVVILSFFDDPAHREAARQAGATAFVAKTDSEEVLLSAIRAAAHLPRPSR